MKSDQSPDDAGAAPGPGEEGAVDRRYRAIFATAADAFWLMDEENRLLDVNDAACRMLGATREELLRLPVPAIEAAEDPEEVRRHTRRIREAGWDRFETRHRRLDGVVIDVEATVSWSEAERTFLVFLRDVSERRRRERSSAGDLRRLELVSRLNRAPPDTHRELLGAVLEQAVELTESGFGHLFQVDDGADRLTLLAWSRAIASQCLAEPPRRVFAPSELGPWAAPIGRRAAVVANDLDAAALAGAAPPCHVPVARLLAVPILEDGRVVAVVGVANREAPYGDEQVRQLSLYLDAIWPTARRVEADEQRHTLAALVEQAPTSIVTFSLDGQVQFANARFLEWTGLAPAAVLGRHVERLGGHGLPLAGAAEVWRAIASGEVWRGEVEREDRRGRAWDLLTVSPVRAPGGAITLVAAVSEDVTRRRELEAQLRHSQRLESMGTLAVGVAHDFNNVLTGILGIAAGAREDLLESHPLRADLDEIVGLVHRATALTRSLLAFGRQQTGRPRPESVGEVIAGVARLLERVIGEQVRLELSPPPEKLVVEADRGQLEQVLLNLATNARDAMPGGGTITVAARPVAVTPEDAAGHGVAPGWYAQLSVRDTGAGMDEAVRSRIFDPFFTTKEAGKGTGLGLSIAYGIVRQHRGFITVWSRPGAGTRFEVHLPLAATAATAAADGAGAEPALARGEGETILVAEDDPAVRGVWCALLRRVGYQVVAVEDGERAVATFAAAPAEIDLVLLDVTMPRLGGADAWAAIREIDPGARVVFASGYPAGWRATGGEPPDRPILPKPVSPAEFLAAIRAELARPRLAPSDP